MMMMIKEKNKHVNIGAHLSVEKFLIKNLPRMHQEYSQPLRFLRHVQLCQFPMQLEPLPSTPFPA